MNLSRRYLPHLTVLLALAVLPVGVHSYAEVRHEDCAHPELLVDYPAVGTTARRAEVVQRRFAAERWVEGSAPAADARSTLDYLVARSYDPKTLYYRPERVAVRSEPLRVELEWVELGDTRLPIRRVQYRSEMTAAYLLVYGGRPVTDPYTAQLRSAPAQLLTGAWPMTLFFVSERTAAPRLEGARERTREWLADAWQRYQRACPQ